jgi:hypothetical protein
VIGDNIGAWCVEERMSNEYCSILRIGPIIFDEDITNETISKKNAAILLRDTILCHFRDKNESSTNNNNTDANTITTTTTTSTGSSSSNNNNLLSISNRYFDARVILLGLDETYNNSHVSGGDSGVDVVNDADQPHNHYHHEDGVILIFNDDNNDDDDDDDDDDNAPTTRNSDAITFDSLDRIHSKIDAPRKISHGNDNNNTHTVVGGVGDLLRLCIGITTTMSNNTKQKITTEDEYSRRILWCLDHGYEYIQVDLSQKEWKTIGFHERDKDGYARVIEAIETCMWSCHVMKTTSLPKSNEMVEEAQEERKEMEEKVAAGQASTNTTLPDGTEREAAAMASLMNGMTHENDDESPPSSSSHEEGNGKLRNQQPLPSQSAQTNRRDEELAFHQLEQLLTEAKSIREASTSNTLSDEERRERAGDTALKLMELLDHLGLDDADDDDEEEEDDSEDEEAND